MSLNDQFNALKDYLNSLNGNYFFLTPRTLTACGLEGFLTNFHIITIEDNPINQLLRDNGVNLFSLEETRGEKGGIPFNTMRLAQAAEVQDYINSFKGIKAIICFKNSAGLEEVCQAKDWVLLAPPALLSRRLENKLNFKELIQSVSLPHPPMIIADIDEKLNFCELIDFFKGPFVFQLAKGYSGLRTFLIDNEDTFNSLKKSLYGKRARLTRFIEGIAITLDACIVGDEVLVLEPILQLTGLKELCRNRLSACGNLLCPPNIPQEVFLASMQMTMKLGEKLKELGYKGIFGVDILYEPKDGRIFFIEINPRLVASIPFITDLEVSLGIPPLLGFHLFQFVSSLIQEDGKPISRMSIPLTGGQVILHNLENHASIVKGELQAGIYQIEEKGIKFCRRGYKASQLKNETEVLVLPIACGSRVNPDSEIGRIYHKNSSFIQNGILSERFSLVVKEVYQALKLSPVRETKPECPAEPE